MALAAGIVIVAGDGEHSGAGLAYELFLAELEANEDMLTYLEADPPPDEEMVLFRKSAAFRSNRTATRLVAYLAANADVRVLQDALDSGIPPTAVVLSGALE